MQNTGHDTDETLVNQLLLGDKTALVTLVKKYHKPFCEKAFWMVKDKDVAKDIAQESWTVIMHKISMLKEPKRFKYWALRIVCNKATDWLRLQSKKQKREIALDRDFKIVDEDDSENETKKAMLSKAIIQLPNKQKAVLRLFYTESYSLKEISKMLNISVGTAKSRLFHARETLKKELNIKNE